MTNDKIVNIGLEQCSSEENINVDSNNTSSITNNVVDNTSSFSEKNSTSNSKKFLLENPENTHTEEVPEIKKDAVKNSNSNIVTSLHKLSENCFSGENVLLNEEFSLNNSSNNSSKNENSETTKLRNRKFEGTVKILPNGVGFMESQDVMLAVEKDAFIDKRDVTELGLQPGDIIKANVRINDTGKPQAFDIEMVKICEEPLPLLGGPCVPDSGLRFLGSHQGVMKLLPNGVGFVHNPVIQATQRRDIFVDRKDVEYYKLGHGDSLKCKVYINNERKPQAFSIEIVKKMAAPTLLGPYGAVPVPNLINGTGSPTALPYDPVRLAGGKACHPNLPSQQVAPCYNHLTPQQQQQVINAQQQLYAILNCNASSPVIPANRALTQEEAFAIARQQLQLLSQQAAQQQQALATQQFVAETNMNAVAEAYAQLAAMGNSTAALPRERGEQSNNGNNFHTNSASNNNTVVTGVNNTIVTSSVPLGKNSPTSSLTTSACARLRSRSHELNGHIGQNSTNTSYYVGQDDAAAYFGSAAGTTMATNVNEFMWDNWSK